MGIFKMGVIAGVIVGFQCRADYPTLEQARELFSPRCIAATDIDMYWGAPYNDFLNALSSQRNSATEGERILMKDFFVNAMTSIVVQVSTNALTEETAAYSRGFAFSRALQSFGDLFATNVTDCLAVAAYIDRVHTVPFSESLIRKRSSVFFYSTDPKEREAWLEKRRAFLAREKPIRELQMRVSEDNDNVRDYRRTLFDLCNACVLANRKIMDDAEFVAFTNRVVELSKPDEREKRRLFDHLGEVKRK